MSISGNLENIRKEMRKLINKEVILVAVTKKRKAIWVNKLFEFGVKNIAENYVGEALEKFSFLNYPFKKHFIGPIQSNKVKKIVRNFDLIQSVDRIKIAKLIDSEAEKIGKIMPILIQVNISGEKTKSGVSAEKLGEFILEISWFKNIKVIGLMSIGSKKKVQEFRMMKSLFDDLKEKGFLMKILSMGMSEDYLEAIKEGSNMVRLGRKIFDERNL